MRFFNGMSQRFFRALRSRNYRLFVCGQSISLTGTWMQQVALGWLVYRLTQSPFLLGVVGFSGQIPTFLVAPFAGVAADRCHRHHMIILTQTLALLQSLALAVLFFSGMLKIWHVIVLSIFLGLINAFDIPVRQAFTIDMIEDREDLSNAIALNSSIVNAARLVGPALAGILITVAGEGICFLLNALSYTAVLASLLRMKISVRPVAESPRHFIRQMRDGMHYAYRSVSIRALLTLMALVSMLGVAYPVLMPVFVREIFSGGPQLLGLLMSVSGIGALGGAFYLAGRSSMRGLETRVAVAAFVFGIGMAVFAHSHRLWFSLVTLLASGFVMMVLFSAGNIMLQTIVSERMRGRVMSLYTMAFMGMAPFGSLLAGALAAQVGAAATLTICGMGCMIAAAFFFYHLPVFRTDPLLAKTTAGAVE
ncbi:MAG: MFS transporter [Candidatus Omnitrophica bacterium]|nr:MFS transporter [Candidatus Omnitrophota bacterium]